MPASRASGTLCEQLPGHLACRLLAKENSARVDLLFRFFPEHFIGENARKKNSDGKKRPHPSDCKGGALFPPEQISLRFERRHRVCLKMNESKHPAREHARHGSQRPKRHPEQEDDSVSLAQLHTFTTPAICILRVPIFQDALHFICP